MIDLTIYDSQGQSLDDPAAAKNERIANFFFDGVRLAIESMDSVRAYCFFRARESEGARLDQFYAEFEASSVSEIGNLKSAVEQKVRDEHEMILESSTEDATVFDLIDEASRLAPPGDRNTRDLIPKLIRRGERPRFGVGNYRDALALLIDVIRNGRVNKAAIADNAESAELSDYDIVIETGNHTGLVPLGNTEDALAREQRSSMRSERGSLSNDPLGDHDSKYQSSIDKSSDETLTGKDKLISIGLISAFGIGILALLIGGGLFGACFLGVSVDLPFIGDPCTSDSGGAGNQTEFSVDGYNTSLYTNNSTIAIRWNGPNSVNHTVSLKNGSGNLVRQNYTINKSSTRRSWQNLPAGNYSIFAINNSGTVKEVWNGTLSSTGAKTNNSQPTGTPTVADTPSNTQESTATEGTSNQSTTSSPS
ncbi:hypothetical protein [Halorientalis regularis]|uniref:Uncharacterized protein n=1 Tax=Halorientalis regularis TaxID=660518 RepID=A0A1G7TTT6_9EURY|nr:hypothetical protein [Halorientalis regularis]SDG38698.1 hypothetical protein SAMN05216218_1305 [Halorientalis regularis]